MELVPSEIEKLLIASPQDSPSTLRSLNERIKKTSMRDAILSHGCEVLKYTGLDVSQIEDVASAWVFMRNRRQRVSQDC